MLNPKSKAPGDDGSTVARQMENRRVEASGQPHIGWSFDRRPDIQVSQDQVASYLSEIHLSHKQITKRFVELLNLFEDYTKILETESGHHGVISIPMKRVLSEQLTRKEGRSRHFSDSHLAKSLTSITLKTESRHISLN